MSRIDPALAFDPGQILPRRFPLRVWILAAIVFLVSYGLLWCHVHIVADMRPCQLRLDDPLFRVVPYSGAWYFVSKQLYVTFTLAAVALLVWRAVRGDQRPLVRWGVALSMQGLLRAVTILLVPLCRANREPGSIVLTEVPTVSVGPFEIPWRMWASNDLLFSGHVGEFVLLTLATRGFPRAFRIPLIVFQVLQVFALLGTRGHYTIDIVVAVPCAFLADGVAVRLLHWLSPKTSPHVAVDTPAAPHEDTSRRVANLD